MIDRCDKEAHAYCVMENSEQNSLFSLVKGNVYTINDHLENEESFFLIIFSDSLANY